MVEQLGDGWWLRRDPGSLPLRLLLVGWRPSMRWQERDQSEARDPFLRLYWNRTAGAAIEHAGRRIPLGPDRLVAILPETPHRRRSSAPADHFFIHAAFTDARWRLPPGVHLLPVEDWWRRELASLLCADPPVRLLLRAATALVSRSLCALPLPDDPVDAGLLALAEALSPYVRHPGGWPGSAAVARRLGVSSRTLTRRFQQLYGQSPRAWIIGRRIDAACDLLAHGDEPIAAIADRLGFGDRFHFTRAFRTARGVGPASWRRSARA